MNTEYLLDIAHIGGPDIGQYVDSPMNYTFEVAYNYGEYIHTLICLDWS